VSLHPLGGAEHQKTSFPDPCMLVVFTLSALFFSSFREWAVTDAWELYHI